MRKLRQVSSIRRRGKSRDCRGIATLEFAVCLPVLVLITLAFIDLTNLVYFRQTIKVAAYDAARTAAEPAATESEVQAAAGRLLQMRGVDAWTLSMPPAFNSISRGTIMQFQLSVPLSEVTSFTGMEFWASSLGNSLTIDMAVAKE